MLTAPHRLAAACLVMAVSAGPAFAQFSQSSFPTPPGTLVTGPVFRGNGSFVPQITNGAEANAYINSTPPTAAFLAGAPAHVVLTTQPTQYVRVFTEGITAPNRAFIAGSSTIRGLTPTQIKDVLALPYLPTSVTIVQIPAGTCILTGTGAPVNGNFAAQPPAIPVAGPWGNGGTYQSYIVGASRSANCAEPQFLPASAYTNQQGLGALALAYAPAAGAGNTGALARALDRAVPPQMFSPGDRLFNVLDSLNFGGSPALQQALSQLTGEVYADTQTAAFSTGRLFLDTLRERQQNAPAGEGWRPWFTAMGAAGSLSGRDGASSLSFGAGGAAFGLDALVNPSLLVGVGFGYTRGSYGTKSLSGSGGLDSYSIAPYLRYSTGAWYLDASAGYAFNAARVSRAIGFTSGYDTIAGRVTGSPQGSGFVSRVEAGYRLPERAGVALTPFLALNGQVFAQRGFTEQGLMPANLAVSGQTTASLQGVLGLEAGYRVASSGLGVTARLGWGHEFQDTARSVNAALAAMPGSGFTATGARVPRDVALLGLGVSLPVGSGQAFLRYTAELAGGLTLQGGMLGGRWSF